MEKVNFIPENFLMEFPLSKEQEKIFIEQMNRFYSLREKYIQLSDIDRTLDGRVVLKKGTIIHGSHFNLDVVEGIKNSGIITGQAFGIPEDGETFYCADFHRIDKDTTMAEFNNSYSYVDGRCPFGNGLRGGSSLAFIIEPIEEASELLAYDCYRKGTRESEITKSFTNVDGLLKNTESLSSILYGVPSNLIKGIVLGNKLLEKKDIVKLIIKMFPNCYLSTIDGIIIYDPKNDMEYSEVVNLRTDNYILNFNNKLLTADLDEKRKNLKQEKSRYDRLIEMMMLNFPIHDVALFLISNNLFQGTIEEAEYYIENIVKKDNEQKKSTFN